MVGKGDLLVTGQLGDVMRESALAALSYIRSRADALDIDPNFQENMDLHIHLPENAIPKDGPSAGITIATALISAIAKRPIREKLAMTGEITLRGRVLGVGGLKEKVLAAHQAGIRHLLIPAENKKEMPEIPVKIQEQMRFTYVDTMDQVISEALLDIQAETEQTLPEPSPLHMDERIVATRDSLGRHSETSGEDDADECDPAVLILPPSDHLAHDGYSHIRAKNAQPKRQ
jgi:ATP-dependent Lon protease